MFIKCLYVDQKKVALNKQQLPLPSPSTSAPSPNETMRPLEINELDEMERVQALKHRENLIKGMGITDFVNRILYGTSGTVATVPPSLANHAHHSKSTNGTLISKNLVSNMNPNHELSQADPLNRTFTTYNPKIEIKTKNYNPFENQSLFSEVNKTLC